MSPSRDEDDLAELPPASYVFPIGEVCVGDVWEYLYKDKSITFVVIWFEIFIAGGAVAHVRLLPTFEKGQILFKPYDNDCIYNLLARLPDDL
jgi:hypothetical protein